MLKILNGAKKDNGRIYLHDASKLYDHFKDFKIGNTTFGKIYDAARPLWIDIKLPIDSIKNMITYL